MTRPMRVLILGSKEFPFGTNKGYDPIPSGGMETYVDDLVPALSKHCRVTVVTRKFRNTKRHEKKGDIEIYRVPWLRGKWLRNPSFNLSSLLLSLGLAKGHDIIYTNGVVSGFAALVLGKLFGKKSVYRPAGISHSQYGFPLRQILFVLERAVFGKSDAVVFHSEGEKRNAKKLFNVTENSFVILTGFPVGKFVSKKGSVRKDMRLGKKFVITSVSRFVPVKGIDKLLEACSMIGQDFRTLLVGSGPEEKRLREMSGKLGLEKKVMFLGFRHDVPRILAATDVFVVSSISEGLPTSLLEAMAAGNACVVTDIGLPVEHEKTGLVVPPRDPEAMAEAFEKLMSDRGLRDRLGSNAQAFVRENCTQGMAAEAHKRAFRDILDSKVG